MTTETLTSQSQPSMLGKKILPGVTVGVLIIVALMIA